MHCIACLLNETPYNMMHSLYDDNEACEIVNSQRDENFCSVFGVYTEHCNVKFVLDENQEDIFL